MIESNNSVIILLGTGDNNDTQPIKKEFDPNNEDEIEDVVNLDHDYCVRSVNPKDLPYLKTNIVEKVEEDEDEENISKQFSKCDRCRRSRTKVLVPNSLLCITNGKNDGVTCDFCGDIMAQVQPQTLPDVFEGRRGSKGGDLNNPNRNIKRKKNYVYCGECGKVVLKGQFTHRIRYFI